MNPKPTSLGWVVLYVDDVAAATRQYTTAFGLATRFEHESGDYTELETGSTTLALCSRALASQSTGLKLTGGDSDHHGGNITLVYDDVASAYDHAVQSGAVSVHEPVTKPWGQVSSYVRDHDGNLIEIASTVPT
jgi:lactoylglutathione lyase